MKQFSSFSERHSASNIRRNDRSSPVARDHSPAIAVMVAQDKPLRVRKTVRRLEGSVETTRVRERIVHSGVLCCVEFSMIEHAPRRSTKLSHVSVSKTAV